MFQPNEIRAIEGFNSMTVEEIIARGGAVGQGMKNNPHFTKRPVDPDEILAAVASLAAANVEALDGSKKAIADRDVKWKIVINMLREQVRYVETHCDNDMSIFLSS